MYIRPLVLRTLILFIVLNTAIGVGTIIAGGNEQFSNFEGSILLTTFAVTGAGLLFLVCFLAYEARRPQPIPAFPAFAVAVILVGLVLVLIRIWLDIESAVLEDATLTIAIIGLAATHICFVSLATIRYPYLGLQVVAALFTALLAAMAVYLVWNEDRTDLHWRIAAVLAVFTAAISLSLPVVSWMLRTRPTGERPLPRRASYCPNCGAVLHMEEPDCLACGSRFTVEFLPRRSRRRRQPLAGRSLLRRPAPVSGGSLTSQTEDYDDDPDEDEADEPRVINDESHIAVRDGENGHDPAIAPRPTDGPNSGSRTRRPDEPPRPNTRDAATRAETPQAGDAPGATGPDAASAADENPDDDDAPDTPKPRRRRRSNKPTEGP